MEKDYIQLVESIKKLGWQIALPKGGGPEDDGMLHGMIIGEDDYINFVLKHLD
jgi:hypothetical protein